MLLNIVGESNLVHFCEGKNKVTGSNIRHFVETNPHAPKALLQMVSLMSQWDIDFNQLMMAMGTMATFDADHACWSMKGNEKLEMDWQIGQVEAGQNAANLAEKG